MNVRHYRGATRLLAVLTLASAVLLCMSCVTTAEPADNPARAGAEQQPHDRPGFSTIVKDGRLWVFRADSEELAEFREKGKPAKHVVRPLAGPMGMTIMSPDSETITEYLVYKPGFEVVLKDGRLWVFRADSEELAEFREKGKPAKHVVRPLAGPMGMTMMAVDSETLDAYMAT